MGRGAAFAALVLVASSGAAAGPEPEPKAPDPLAAEARKRSDTLVEAGFNLTHGFSLRGPGAGILRMSILVPPREGEHVMSVWWETPEGEVSMEVRGPGGGALQAALRGRRVETTLVLALAPGPYSLEIDRSKARGGHALIGFKGALVAPCGTKDARVKEIAADPSKKFFWPYLLYLPKEPRAGRLLVAPNNTGFASEDLELIRASASCEVRRQSALAEKLGAPLLVPLFPRPTVAGEAENLYLHALTRAALTAEAPRLRRVDLQLLAMADDARRLLEAKGVLVDERLLLRGFSASGSFVNRFAVLHPGRVLAVACGSPGGWPIAPAGDAGGEALPYPVGVADVRTLVGQPVDTRALKAVAWLFFLGGKDANDAVIYRDSFSKADETLVFRLFGPTPVARWKKAEDLYAKAGLDARFVLYPGVAHEVTPEIDADVAKFFEAALAAAPPAAR